MTTELEVAIQDALAARAQSVRPEDLRHRSSLTQSHAQSEPQPLSARAVTSRLRRRLPLAVAAAVVVILAVAGGAWVVRGARGSDRSSAGSAVAAVGYRWRVTEVAKSGAPTPVPPAWDVYLDLSKNGQFVANDGVNTISGTYRARSTSITIGQAASTLIGIGPGADPTRVLVAAAVDAFLDGPVGGANRVVLTNAGLTMTVTASGYTLTYSRTGSATNR